MEQTTEGADCLAARVLQRMYNNRGHNSVRLGTPLHASAATATRSSGFAASCPRAWPPKWSVKRRVWRPQSARLRAPLLTCRQRAQRVLLERLPGAGGMGAAARVRLGAASGGARQPPVGQREACHDHLGQRERVP